MAHGRKTGGRHAGTPNRFRRGEIETLIDGLAGPGARKCFESLATIAFEPHNDVRARLIANRTLLEYRHGKPTERHEHLGAGGQPLKVILEVHP